MREEWRDAVGFEGRYEVSSRARLRNVRSGRVHKGTPNADGYITVRLARERGQSRTYYLHRLVCAAFNGPPPSLGHVVNHLNGEKIDCRAANLAWCTRAENCAHASRLGLLKGPFGAKNAHARLNDAAVIEMRRQSRSGVSYAQLARAYGVAVATAYRAVVGLTWRHLRVDQPTAQ